MTSRRTLRSAVATAAVALSPLALPAQIIGEGHPSLDPLHGPIVATMAQAGIPGATVAASRGGRLVFNKGFGFADLGTGFPMTPRTRCRIGSTSKVLTALALLKLTDQVPSFTTKRTLYGPGGVVPDYLFQVALDYGPMHPLIAGQIRIDHLLSHSSGFVGGGSPEAAAQRFGIPLEAVTYREVHADFLFRKALGYFPGTDAVYSNHNLGLCSLVIERVSGLGYANYVDSQICHPIGMDDTVPTGSTNSGWEATPHLYAGSGAPIVWAHRADPHPTEYGAGGWSSTARDLVRMMCAGDKLRNRTDVLLPATADLMASRPYPAATTTRAHGWAITKSGKLWHNGSIGGGASYIARFPAGYVSAGGIDLSEVTVAVCVNIQNAGALSALVDSVALAVGAASLPRSYDLFVGSR